MPTSVYPPWEHYPFKADYDNINGYPFPSTSPTIYEFNPDLIGSRFISNTTTGGYFHPIPDPHTFNLRRLYNNFISTENVIDEYYYPRVEPSKFMLSRVYSDWNRDEDEISGYPEPTASPTLYKMGAFSYTEGIESLYIPISVKEIGMYAMSNSEIESIRISPICKIYESSTTETCEILYHPTTINSVEYPINPIVFSAGDNWKSILEDTIANITISDATDSETLNYNKLSFDGVDTYKVGNNIPATLNVLSYNGDIVATKEFSYKVELPDKQIVSIIPAMTGYTTPSGKVIYTSSYGSSLAWYAFDGNDTQSATNSWTDWNNRLNNTPNKCYVGYEFKKYVYVDNISVSFYGTVEYNACFQCRYNGEWITTISSITIPALPNYNKLDIQLSNKMICDAVRLCILSGDKPYFMMYNGGSNVCELVVNGFEL